MELIAIWLVLCGLVAFWANSRGQNGLVMFIASVILSPLIGAIFVLVVGDKNPPAVVANTPVDTAATADALTKLVALRDAGHLTEEEFQTQRGYLFPAAGPMVQAPPNHKCGKCGKPLSPVWKNRCEHCKATYVMYPPEPR